MNILAMDTANQILGVALLREGKLAGAHLTNMNKNHSVRLMPAVEALMQEVDMQPDVLDRIVVSQGPGSYTGVRIGVTTAKTMAWALGIPVVGVSSLEVLAYQGRFSSQTICSFFDARRGLVYAGLYQWNGEQLDAVQDEQNLLMEDLLHQLKEKGDKVLFLSPDMTLHKESIQTIMGDLAVIPAEPYQYPSPVHLAYYGMLKEPENVHSLTPNYIRLAEAEAKWMKTKKDL